MFCKHSSHTFALASGLMVVSVLTGCTITFDNLPTAQPPATLVSIAAAPSVSLYDGTQDGNTATPTFEQVNVTYTIDGDTIIAIVDGKEEHIRLIGMNCPERGDPGGSEATEYTRSAIDQAGNSVYLQSDPTLTDRDPYGRLLRYVWLAEPPTPLDSQTIHAILLNQLLVDSGHAQYWGAGINP